MIMVFGGQDWIDGDATQQLGAGSRPISETVGGRIREREDRPLGGPGVHDEARPFAEVTDLSAVLVLGPLAGAGTCFGPHRPANDSHRS
jgi:hypothetical protein